jgi:hypothetical protein
MKRLFTLLIEYKVVFEFVRKRLSRHSVKYYEQNGGGV